MSDKIELIRLCRVLQRNFSCLSQSDSRTEPCHVRILFLSYVYLLTSLQLMAPNWSIFCLALFLKYT